MDQNQRELRHAAAKAFMESLNQLGTSLTADNELSLEPATQAASSKRPEAIKIDSVEALEEAAADIEQFIDAQDAEA